MILKEIWKPVKGYEGLYEVSNMGQVRSLNYRCTGKVKVLSPLIVSSGYHQVILFKDNKKKQLYIHRLVVTAFRGPIPVGMVVNHINEIKSDNRLSNLEICTVAQNNNHGTRNERVAKANAKALLGNTNRAKQLKLTNAKTSAKYTFSSSCEASVFFGYKNKSQIGCNIYKAHKKGKNFIKIQGEKHYFVQESDK